MYSFRSCWGCLIRFRTVRNPKNLGRKVFQTFGYMLTFLNSNGSLPTVFCHQQCCVIPLNLQEWMVVTIDDKLPYWKRPGRHGNLCFAKQTKENEFWPCLLEKAVAKFVMSYHRIDGGFEASALDAWIFRMGTTWRLHPKLGIIWDAPQTEGGLEKVCQLLAVLVPQWIGFLYEQPKRFKIMIRMPHWNPSEKM